MQFERSLHTYGMVWCNNNSNTNVTVLLTCLTYGAQGCFISKIKTWRISERVTRVCRFEEKVHFHKYVELCNKQIVKENFFFDDTRLLLLFLDTNFFRFTKMTILFSTKKMSNPNIFYGVIIMFKFETDLFTLFFYKKAGNHSKWDQKIKMTKDESF